MGRPRWRTRLGFGTWGTTGDPDRVVRVSVRPHGKHRAMLDQVSRDVLSVGEGGDGRAAAQDDQPETGFLWGWSNGAPWRGSDEIS